MKPPSNSKPHLVVMVGIPGSGKSYFAEHFAGTFKAPIISHDRITKELFGLTVTDTKTTAVINKVAGYLLDEVLKTGRTVVFDGQTDLRTERANIAKKSKDAGYDPLFIWVQTESITAQKRATKRSPDKSVISNDEFDDKLKRFSAPHSSEKPVVISGKHTYNSQLKIVLRHLVEPRAQVIVPITKPRSVITRNTLIR